MKTEEEIKDKIKELETDLVKIDRAKKNYDILSQDFKWDIELNMEYCVCYSMMRILKWVSG